MNPKLKHFLKHERGAAAVEFAIIAPLLVAIGLAGFTAWDAAGRKQDLTSALNVGAEYYMLGGGDDAEAEGLVLAGWDKRPSFTEVEIIRECRCGVQIATCSTLCSSSAPPSAFVTIEAQASYPDALAVKLTNGSRTVRVR